MLCMQKWQIMNLFIGCRVFYGVDSKRIELESPSWSGLVRFGQVLNLLQNLTNRDFLAQFV